MLCELGRIEIKAHFLFYFPVYEGVRGVHLTEMSSIYVDFFWLDDMKNVCFRRGNLCCSRFVCQVWKRRQNIL